MKRTFKTILCAAAAVLAAVSCQKSTEPVQTAEEGKGTIDICVNGLMGEYTQQDGVKSSLVNNVRVAWAAGDVVYVFDGSNYLGKLTAALDKKADGLTDEDRYAKLGGTISAPATTPCVLSLVHSSLMTEPAVGASVSELSIDMSAQSTATVPFVAYATLEYTGTTITDVVVPFQFATSVIKVNCTGLKANTAITSATLTNVNTACKLTLYGSAAPTVSGDVNGTITRTGDAYFAADKVNGEGEAVFQIAVPKLSEVPGARVLTAAQGSKNFEDKNFTTKYLSAATSVNTVCQLVNVLPAGALHGVFTVSKGDDNKAGTADDVRVRFSKGNLIATIDASGAPTAWKFAANQYDYLGTGGANKTIGSATGDVDLFGWSTTSTTYGISTSQSPDDYSGDFVDWGKAIDNKNTWRTLSKDEWTYLINKDGDENIRKGKYKLGVTVCEKTYCLILAPDDFTGTIAASYNAAAWASAEAAGLVCLPAAGSRYGSTVSLDGNYGYYWSSSADVELYFYGGGVEPGKTGSRYGGFSVRLITE